MIRINRFDTQLYLRSYNINIQFAKIIFHHIFKYNHISVEFFLTNFHTPHFKQAHTHTDAHPHIHTFVSGTVLLDLLTIPDLEQQQQNTMKLKTFMA